MKTLHEPDFGCGCSTCDKYWSNLEPPIPEGKTEEFDDEYEGQRDEDYGLR